jgi:protein-tyrosine phosphatase
VGLDEYNVEDLQQAYGRKSNIYLLLDFARNVRERNVPDPYYSGNFEYVYQLVLAGCQGLLETIRQENGI